MSGKRWLVSGAGVALLGLGLWWARERRPEAPPAEPTDSAPERPAAASPPARKPHVPAAPRLVVAEGPGDEDETVKNPATFIRRIDDCLDKAADTLRSGSEEHENAFASQTESALDDIEAWADAADDESPLATEIGELVDSLSEDLDLLEEQSGAAANRTTAKLQAGLKRLRDKLVAARRAWR
jgi:hypothetical protein